MLQSESELEKHLEEHLGFLRTSAELFDKGNKTEAKRLAVSVRVLVHDTKQSRSLLGQLSKKDRDFLDTAQPRTKTVVTSYTGLVGTSFMGGPSEYVPHLATHKGVMLPFAQWWDAPVIADFEQREISRRGLILAVANQDGGAHVDPELNEIYAGVSRANAMGRVRLRDTGWEAVPDLAQATVRQIAHEVLVTLDPQYAPVAVERPGHLVIGGFELGIAAEPIPSPPRVQKVGRNDVCPCGSGKKFKRCHGG